MGKKRDFPTHSQVIGIVWLSITLLLSAGAIIFSSHHGGGGGQKGSTTPSDSIKLTYHEDSVYRSRGYARRPGSRRPAKAVGGVRSDSAPTPRQTPVYRRQKLTVELNSADTTTLQLLYGIGPTYARRIVRYRERLGGFVSKSQLLEVYGIGQPLLDDLAPHLTVDSSAIRRIRINEAGLKELLKHPYIEYYQARDIVRLRDRGALFTSADDLRAVPSMTDSTLERLLPYLEF